MKIMTLASPFKTCVASLLALTFSLTYATLTHARTITLDDSQVMQMAHIGPEIPEACWLGAHLVPGMYYSVYIEMTPGRRLLIRYPLEQIPKGQRIVSAQWIFPITYAPYPSQRLFIWRVLQPWGLGVNYTMRTQFPKPLPWSSPGADAPGVDRAITPTAAIRIQSAEEQIIDVTQDVQLWYSGVAPNNGWVMALDEGNQYLRLGNPMYDAKGVYKLRITYEPE